MQKEGKVRLISLLLGALKISFFVFLLFGFYTPSLAFLSLLVIFIHESGHFLSLLLLGKPAVFLAGHLYGFRMECRVLSYREEILVALCGPLFNFLFAVISFLFLPRAFDFVSDFIILSILTGVFNLLPVEGFDGERILTAFLSARVSSFTVYTVKRSLSLFFIAAFLFLSLSTLSLSGDGFFVFGVFFFSLLRFIQNSRICEKTSI